MVKQGSTVSVFYTGTLDDGTVFDSNVGQEPLSFTAGGGQMIPGFDAAVLEMEVGDKKTIHIPCAEAYGEHNENAIQKIAIDEIPNADQLPVGQRIYFQGPNDQPIGAKVIKVDDEFAHFDFNHELAGEDLNFEIELVSAE